jgi:hypothetical protein
MDLNETHFTASRAATATLSTEEAALLESLRANPGFADYPKDQLDRHTIKQLLVATCDSPVSVCERASRKAETLMAQGALNESLEATNGKTSLCEAEVPEEKPLAPEGEGDLPQGDADSTSSEHDGEDHENPGKEDSEADDDGTKQGGPRGDQSGTADKGYKDEKQESKDVEHGHDEDDAFQLEADDEDGAPDVPVESCGAEDSTIPAAGKGEKGKEPSKKQPELGESDDDEDDEDDLNEEGAEGSQNDAKDPAPEEDRAASDAKYKDGAKQNEAEETPDVKDPPDLDDVEKEDPANSELDKGPADPKLESLSDIEERIINILGEAGIKKGSQRWTEAYLRGWNLAMEHRAKKLDS